MNRFISHWGLGLTLLAGCGVDATSADRIGVTEPNTIGVESLSIEHLVSAGNDVVLLHAFGATDHEVAFVRLTTGEIADLSRSLPGANDVGSELVVSVGGVESRSITRSTQRIDLGLEVIQAPSIVALLEIAPVSAALANEANVFVTGSRTQEVELLGYPSTAQNCSPSSMLARGVAQCCEYNKQSSGGAFDHATYHVNPDESTAKRERSPWGVGCTSLNGGSCSGAACYYGPFAYSRPMLTNPSFTTPYGYTYKTSYSNQNECNQTHLAEQPVHQFAEVFGTQSTSQGCPGGATGAGDWDY